MSKRVYRDVQIGDKCHRWEVIAFDPNPLYVLCRCSCEAKTERRVNKKNFKAELTKSCGCWVSDHKKTHGMSRTRTYRLWQSMHSRVKLNTYYIQKGIKVCERWCGDDGFANFLEDMKECPIDKKSLDRYPNPHGNYEPGNCRWANDSEQQRNKTSTRLYRFRDKSGVEKEQSAAAWAEEYSLALNTLLGRLDRKWTLERALTTPQGMRRGRGAPQAKDRLIFYKDKEQTLGQWAMDFGLHVSTMVDRLYHGWSMEKIERTPQGYRSDYPKAAEHDALVRTSPSFDKVGGELLKYLTPVDALNTLTDLLIAADPLALEKAVNAICGGAHPILKIVGCPATKFAIRDDPV